MTELMGTLRITRRRHVSIGGDGDDDNDGGTDETCGIGGTGHTGGVIGVGGSGGGYGIALASSLVLFLLLIATNGATATAAPQPGDIGGILNEFY